MDNKDTIHLLKECDAGSKMAVSSIDDVLDNVSDSNMKNILQESKNQSARAGLSKGKAALLSPLRAWQPETKWNTYF